MQPLTCLARAAAPRTLALALLTLAAASARPAAQGGYRTEEIEALGISYPCARDYDAIPTQPTEQWVIAQWAERLPRDRGERKKVRPEVWIVWIDWVPDPGPTTGVGGDAPPPGEADEEAPAEPPPMPVNSLERYLGRMGWTLRAPAEGRERDGYQAVEYALEREKQGDLRAWAYEYKSKKRTIAFLGFCAVDDWDEQTKIWRTMATKARFREPAPPDMSKWESFYERRPELVDASYRLEVRRGLVRGWDADDTENFIFVYSTKDQELLRVMKRELEAIRLAYVELFPPLAPIEAVSSVRICKDADEYFQYGGPRGSGGYWNSSAKELVFFDYDSLDQKGKKKKGRANSRIVLYHEAFHQYIHYSTGELPPHSWYNEGTGDYFSGAVINGTRVQKIDVNPWRVGLIKQAVAQSRQVPWRDIVRFERSDYYRPDRRSICYAQGWSMIYFLRTAKEVERRADWSRILPTYFDVLKAQYTAALAELGPEPAPEQRAEAGERAREKAVAAAFDEIDFDEIEAAWKGFVGKLEEPR